jgi:hypothetical protein
MCVQKKRICIFHNLKPEQIFEELVNFKFAKFSNLFEAISLTSIQKDKDNTSSEIDCSNIFSKLSAIYQNDA